MISKQAAAIAEKKKAGAGKPTMNIEQADDGSLISKTGRTNDSYDQKPVTKTHPNANALMSHIKATFPPPAKPATKAPPSEWANVANQMIASGGSPPKASNGGR